MRDDAPVAARARQAAGLRQGEGQGHPPERPRARGRPLADGFSPDDCLVWDETRANPAIAFLLAQMEPPRFPTPIGVLRRVEMPTYESARDRADRAGDRPARGRQPRQAAALRRRLDRPRGRDDLLIPLGPRRDGGGFRFALHARAREVAVELFEVGGAHPFGILRLERDGSVAEPFAIWSGVAAGAPRPFRVRGPRRRRSAAARSLRARPRRRRNLGTERRSARPRRRPALPRPLARPRAAGRGAGRRAAAAAAGPAGHLRAPRPRLHAPPLGGRRAARDLPRADREDPLPRLARRHHGRAAAGLRVRRDREPAARIPPAAPVS